MKFILIANTSKYLYHYRKLLIKKLYQKFKYVKVVCPEDEYSNELKKIVGFTNWKLSTSNEYNLIELINSLYKLFYFIKCDQPEIVHSHTLKPNLLVSIVNFFFGIKTVISFPGLGRLSTSKGFKNLLLKFIIRKIYQFSIYEIKNIFFLQRNYNRVKFIFQNPIDKKFFLEVVKARENSKMFYLIPGSGVPTKYLSSSKKYYNDESKNFDFIYCARLEKSKGIELFINLSFLYPESRFFIYGDISRNSKDNISNSEINKIKGNNKNIFFMGYKKDPLLKHHNDHTIFVIPSVYGEGLPRGILESISLEIPVIANVKSCVGLFDNKDLFLVNNNDINSYRENIEIIINKRNSGELNQFLKNSRENIIKKYQEPIIVQKTIDLYNSFLH